MRSRVATVLLGLSTMGLVSASGGGCHAVSGLTDFDLAEGGSGGVAGVGGMATGSGGANAGGGGGEAPTLSDEDLIVRYYLDEAESGTGPSTVFDAAPEPADLPIDYGSDQPPNMMYETVSGQRGLVWADQLDDGMPSAAVEGKIFDALDGATQLTLEIVYEIDTTHGNCPRLFDISRSTNAGELSFCFDDDTVELRLNGARSIEGPFSIAGTGRHVGHVVLDTTRPNAGERARYIHDGAVVTNGASGTGLNETVNLESSDVMALGNRFVDEARSMDGHLFYVALYSVAFDMQRIGDHVARLTVDDDAR